MTPTFRTLTGTLAAGAIALAGLTATAAPANASDRDLARLLAGAVILGIIAHGVNEDRKSRQAHAQPPKTQRPPQHSRPHRVQLPQACAVTTRTRHGAQQTFYTVDCLRRNRVEVRALPRHCVTDIRTRRHGPTVAAFSGACLRDAGYRTARR